MKNLINEIIKPIQDWIDKDERISYLENKVESLNKRIHDLRIKKSNTYKIIYNPNGDSLWFIDGNNTIYIQGKPLDLDGVNCDEIIIVNDDQIDEEYINKNIKPMGCFKQANIKYVGGKNV